MLNEITLPDDYTGTLAQENAIIQDINDNFVQVIEEIKSLDDKVLSFEDHIIDFEGYQIEVFFSENKSHATITAINDTIIVEIADKVIRIDSDGNLI